MTKRRAARLKSALGRLLSKVFRTDCGVLMGACWRDEHGGEREFGLLLHCFKSYVQGTHLFNTYSVPDAGMQDAVVSQVTGELLLSLQYPPYPLPAHKTRYDLRSPSGPWSWQKSFTEEG